MVPIILNDKRESHIKPDADQGCFAQPLAEVSEGLESTVASQSPWLGLHGDSNEVLSPVTDHFLALSEPDDHLAVSSYFLQHLALIRVIDLTHICSILKMTPGILMPIL